MTAIVTNAAAAAAASPFAGAGSQADAAAIHRAGSSGGTAAIAATTVGSHGRLSSGGRADSAFLTLHGLATSKRQGQVVPFTLIDDPCAWTGKRWANGVQDIIIEVDKEHHDDLVKATGQFLASSRPLTALRRPEDFPLNAAITARLATARQELLSGTGVAVLRGLPIDEIEAAFGGEERAILAAYLGVCAHIGAPGPQWRCGRILTHVTSKGGSVTKNLETAAREKRGGAEAFNRADDFEMHHDSCADVLSLLCINQAKSGGESAFASAAAVYNEMIRRGRLDAVATLAGGGWFRDKSRFHPDLVGEEGAGADPNSDSDASLWEMPVFSWRKGYFTAAYNGNLNRQCEQRFNRRLTPLQKEAMALFDEIANADSMKLSLRLQRGDVAFVNNLVVMHSRSKFEDDPEQPRHLVRGWLLALGSPHALPHRLMFPRTYSRYVGVGGPVAPVDEDMEMCDEVCDAAAAPPAAAAAPPGGLRTPSFMSAMRGGLMPSVQKMTVGSLYVPYSSGERAD
jgi:hypothetical protein